MKSNKSFTATLIATMVVMSFINISCVKTKQNSIKGNYSNVDKHVLVLYNNDTIDYFNIDIHAKGTKLIMHEYSIMNNDTITNLTKYMKYKIHENTITFIQYKDSDYKDKLTTSDTYFEHFNDNSIMIFKTLYKKE